MSMYEYQCPNCNHVYEDIRDYIDRDNQFICPNCIMLCYRKMSVSNLNLKPFHMGAVLDNGQVVPGHFGKDAKREKKK